MNPNQTHTAKSKIMAQCRHNGTTITALREQVLDIVLHMSGVIKAYHVNLRKRKSKHYVLS